MFSRVAVLSELGYTSKHSSPGWTLFIPQTIERQTITVRVTAQQDQTLPAFSGRGFPKKNRWHRRAEDPLKINVSYPEHKL
ncbi:hypothetical protein T265_06791 [Opisthorchis viverrini]|uniref:Uncharacterized protein n=1 Tax=Opisthorchis viverrini TaxID=6198 RepID=A0A074ZR48_OPIVI|nr:hypothetical protein T265_06791 [Opisthorchis viverrini]KER25815.1 hypothetical protein T265_06791 [Opisthorchis viverrini]